MKNDGIFSNRIGRIGSRAACLHFFALASELVNEVLLNPGTGLKRRSFVRFGAEPERGLIWEQFLMFLVGWWLSPWWGYGPGNSWEHCLPGVGPTPGISSSVFLLVATPRQQSVQFQDQIKKSVEAAIQKTRPEPDDPLRA